MIFKYREIGHLPSKLFVVRLLPIEHKSRVNHAEDMKPILKYPGGKSKEIPQLTKYIPAYKGMYVEPFFGGGAMFFHLEPCKAIINDINTRLMWFYTAVQQDFHQLSSELPQIEEIYKSNRRTLEQVAAQHTNIKTQDANEVLYYHLRDMYNGNVRADYSLATLYYFINKTAYSGMIRYNSKGEYNVPYGKYRNFNASLLTEQHHNLLTRARIFNVDYREIFNLTRNDDFMFLDPPYDCVFIDYGNNEHQDGFNEESHRQLAQDFNNLGCRLCW